MRQKTFLLSILLAITPFIETAFLGVLPYPLAVIPIFPFMVMVVFFILQSPRRHILILTAATWRDLVLGTTFAATLVGALFILGVLIIMEYLIANRTLLADSLMMLGSYSAYPLGLAIASTLALRINPAIEPYDITVANLVIGWIFGILMLVIFRPLLVDRHRTLAVL